ncbi:MAG TPA: medium chain dehydrogenase/reductase family protein [Polyangiaceae bacterium]|jgi:NADPH:quinone reductase-like Zn-dependent oxidoreductase
MRRVWISRPGPPEVLQVREEPDPEPKPGEVRIRAHACGINFADLMARVGLYPDAPKIPCVIGYEVAGVIDRVGEGVTTFHEGDRVMGIPYFGGYTDTLCISADQVFRLPEKMTFEEGAALPVVYGTAYNMMLFCGNLREGSTILLHSAAGGVGLAAIDLAKTRKCTVIGIASASKHEFLKERGCQHTIGHEEDYVAKTREIVGERGVDLVLDPVGGKSWREGFELLAPCGRMVCFGFSAAAAGKTRSLWTAATNFLRVPKFSPMQLMDSNRTVSGTNMAHLFARLDLLKSSFEDLMRMYERGEVRPFVGKTFKFDDAPQAHHHIHDRKARGKVLLVP